MKLIKRLIFIFFFVLIGLNTWIIISTKSNIYDSVDKIPYNEVGVVLGTSNRNRDGGENKFFKERMSTAASLYKHGKVDRLIVSGSNSSKYYNEPKMMAAALVELGVPLDSILFDTQGNRTISSIENCKDIFSLSKFTIITQQFHGYRALFICNYYDLEAQVMRTERLPLKESGNVRLREFFARIKAVSDLYLVK